MVAEEASYLVSISILKGIISLYSFESTLISFSLYSKYKSKLPQSSLFSNPLKDLSSEILVISSTFVLS